MAHEPVLGRRDLFLRRFTPARPPADPLHISSAVVTVRPERASDIARVIAALPGVEVHAIENSKIVVVLEGPDSGAIGARLIEIALMDGVFSANMVFEQLDPGESQGGAS